MNKVLAVIPARGGSKGIPRKNLLPLCGRPLIAWTIGAARRSRLVDRILVSTDDREVAEAARRAGAEVVERPPAISGDRSSSEAALIHALGALQAAEGYSPGILVMLQCTSPLMTAEDIDGTVRLLTEGSFDCALAVAEFHHFLWEEQPAGLVGVNHDPRARLLRQERTPQFLETGAVYAMRTEGFLKARHRFFGRTGGYVMPAGRVLEIDAPADARLAEARLRAGLKAEARALLPDLVQALVLDFDGVLTDDRVTVSEDGREMVVCSRGDGRGIERVLRTGLAMVVLSREKNAVVAARCRKLGLDCIQGLEDKVASLREWTGKKGIDLAKTVYVGNDVPDLECMEAVGCAVAVADAHEQVQAAADIVLERRGGRGAVREVCDLLLDKLGP